MNDNDNDFYTPETLNQIVVIDGKLPPNIREFIEFIGYEEELEENIKKQEGYIPFFKKALYHKDDIIVFWALVGLETLNKKIFINFINDIYNLHRKYKNNNGLYISINNNINYLLKHNVYFKSVYVIKPKQFLGSKERQLHSIND